MEFLHQFQGSLHGAAGGQKVVVEQYHVVLADGVFVYLDGVYAVLLGVRLLHGLGGQFAGLAAEHDAGAEFHGQG